MTRHVCLLAMPALLLAYNVVYSESLIVADGATRIIQASEQNMILDRLELGDNATIRFGVGVDHWEVWADEAAFGENALIDARGLVGSDGAHGKKGRSTNTPGKYGERGGHGQAGKDGSRGIDLSFRVKVAQFGGVLIDASGANGGVGGNGGAGGKSGDARCSDRKKARNGQQGGNAGRGGDGGNGGVIDFRYTSTLSGFDDEHEDSFEELTLPGINLVSYGGGGGSAGAVGKGGAGGHGNSGCRPKMGGGKRGGKGSKASAGDDGSPGTVSIVKDDFKPDSFPSGDDLEKKQDAVYYEEVRYP